MADPSTLEEWWPLFGLRVRTRRLELRVHTDDDLAELADLVGRGVHPPDEMPFLMPWTDAPPPLLQRQTLQYVWRMRAEWTPEAWHLALGAWEHGRLVGQQSVEAKDFATVRTVDTGSWVGRAHQGAGIGKEMRAAVLHLAFAGLGADRADTEAFEDNPASLAVTRSLGYVPNGEGLHVRRDLPVRCLRFTLPRERWERGRRGDITIEGLEPAMDLFRASPPPAP